MKRPVTPAATARRARFGWGRIDVAEVEGRPSPRGFTLLEFLIALTLLALMAGAMFSSLRLVLNSYEKSQERLDQRARQRALEDVIRRQIGSLYPLRPTFAFLTSEAELSNMGVGAAGADPLRAQVPLFYGTHESMTFVTLAALRTLENPGLTVVRYGLAEDEWGKTYLGAMETRFDGLDSFQMMADIPSGKPLAVIEGVSEVFFEYYGYEIESQSYQWFEEWLGEEKRAVPSAVRILADAHTLVVPVNASFFGTLRRGGIRDLIQR